MISKTAQTLILRNSLLNLCKISPLIMGHHAPFGGKKQAENDDFFSDNIDSSNFDDILGDIDQNKSFDIKRPTSQYFNAERKGRSDRDGKQKKIFNKSQQSSFRVSHKSGEAFNIKDYIQKINETNKEFLGIKTNTEYSKFYNEKTFADICKPSKTQNYKLSDLPFAFSSEQTEAVEDPPKSKVDQLLSRMVKEERLSQELSSLVSSYFSDLIRGQRNCRMEVNFEMQSRKVVATLKGNGYSFTVSDESSQPLIKIQKASLFKGVNVSRNENYTSDSYLTENEQSEITQFSLNKKKNEKYPEREWFALKNIVLRIETEVTKAPIVSVSEPNSQTQSTVGIHKFVFQANLTLPPPLSSLSLSEDEYLGAYRLSLNSLCVTNVDAKNLYFGFSHSKEDKESKMINKIV